MCLLKTKYGPLGSFVNVLKPCKRKGFQHSVLADLCNRTGIIQLKDRVLSSRICTTCFRKFCTYSKFFELLAEAINKPAHFLAGLRVSGQERALPVNQERKTIKILYKISREQSDHQLYVVVFLHRPLLTNSQRKKKKKQSSVWNLVKSRSMRKTRNFTFLSSGIHPKQPSRHLVVFASHIGNHRLTLFRLKLTVFPVIEEDFQTCLGFRFPVLWIQEISPLQFDWRWRFLEGKLQGHSHFMNLIKQRPRQKLNSKHVFFQSM